MVSLPPPPKIYPRASHFYPKLLLDEKDSLLEHQEHSKCKQRLNLMKSKNNGENLTNMDKKKHQLHDESYKRSQIMVNINEGVTHKERSLVTKVKSIFTRKKFNMKPTKTNDNEYFSFSESKILVRGDSCMNHGSQTVSQCNDSGSAASQDPSICSRSLNRCVFHTQNNCHVHLLQECQTPNFPHASCLHFQNRDIFVNCQSCCVHNHSCCDTMLLRNSPTPTPCCRPVFPRPERLYHRDDYNTVIVPTTDSRSTNVPIHNSSPSTVVSRSRTESSIHLNEYLRLRQVNWYWGHLPLDEAEQILRNRVNGMFMVRDSSHSKHVFTISFRVNNCTHHTRIQFSRNKYFLSQVADTDGFSTVVELINSIVRRSKSGRYSYFQAIEDPQSATYAVLLLYPLSRCRIMSSLKHIARFVIVKQVANEHLEELPLPFHLVSYLQDKKHYYMENCHNYIKMMNESRPPCGS